MSGTANPPVRLNTLEQLAIDLDKIDSTCLRTTTVEALWFSLEEADKLKTVYRVTTDDSYDTQDATGNKVKANDSICTKLNSAIACSVWYAIIYLGKCPDDIDPDLGPAFLHCIVSWAKSSAGSPLLALDAKWPVQGTAFTTSLNEKVNKFREFILSIATACGKCTTPAELGEQIAKSLGVDQPAATFTKFSTFWSIVYSGKRVALFQSFLMYFLRLMVKSGADLKLLYESPNHFKGLFSFCKLPKQDAFTPLCPDYLSVLADSLSDYRPTMGNYLANAYCNLGESDYEILKKFFALRFEYHGLANLNWAKRILKARAPLVATIAKIATQENLLDLKKLIYSVLLYVEQKNSFGAQAKADVGAPESLTEQDMKSARFARLYSSKFMTWLTYARTDHLSHHLSGFALGLELDSLAKTPALVNAGAPAFTRSYRVGVLMQDYAMLQDPELSEEMKEVINDDIKSNPNARAKLPVTAKLEDYTSARLISMGMTPTVLGLRALITSVPMPPQLAAKVPLPSAPVAPTTPAPGQPAASASGQPTASTSGQPTTTPAPASAPSATAPPSSTISWAIV